jgi:hypothetical protein
MIQTGKRFPRDTKKLMILLHHLVIAKEGTCTELKGFLYEYDERGDT